jgi:chitodextrinase
MTLPSSTVKSPFASITFADTDDWGTGFIGAVTIENTSGSVLNGWTLTFNLSQTITDIWNAVLVSHVGDTYVVANEPWDPTITKGGSVSFGFQTDGGNPAMPAGAILNGTTIGPVAAPPPAPPPPPPPPPVAPLPTLSVADASVSTSGTGAHQDAFIVTLSAPVSGPITVAYATQNGTALAGTDYIAQTGTVTFAPGTTTQTIDVAALPGSAPTETFSLVLSAPVGATLARADATGTILNPPGGKLISNVAPWSATATYTAGMEAAENGLVYQANWWTQGNDPATNNGAAGTGEPWTDVGIVKPITSVPTVPTGLTSTAASSTTAWLSWNAASIPGGGSASSYGVFENGKQIGTTTGTSYIASGLTASTPYQFAVDAIDTIGPSASSAPLTVTTAAAPQDGAAIQIFAPYIDMGLAQDANLLAISQASGIQTFTLAFLQSSGPGTVGWSGVGTINNDTLQDGSTILAQVQALQAAGGNVIISFGGANGTDPAAAATSAQQLQAEYQSVIDRYGVNSLDFDIEGAEVADTKSMTLRDQALIGLKAANPGLTISYTLPVLPTGLDANGLNVLATAKKDGLTPDVVNIMAMDYGSSVDNGAQMGADAISAALATESQLSFLGLNSKIGITPMIGVNDNASEIFTLANAQALESFAAGNPDVVRLAMWSVARDNGATAGANYASPDSSGIAQAQYQFAAIFKQF